MKHLISPIIHATSMRAFAIVAATRAKQKTKGRGIEKKRRRETNANGAYGQCRVYVYVICKRGKCI